MDDLIKRETVLAFVRRCKDRLQGKGLTYDILVDYIESIPSADRPQGEWKHDGSVWTYRFNCTNCGYHLLGKQTNYCPYCGARMKGADDE